MTLMKFYQSFTGSPTNSLIFILGGLLFSSGLGGYFSRNYSNKKILLSFFGIILVSFYHIFAGRQLLSLTGGPLWLKNLFLTVSIFPLGFLMGIPFPFGLEKVKHLFTELHVPAYIAINSLASAFGIILGLFLSVSLGFTITSLLGISCYIFALILVFFPVH